MGTRGRFAEEVLWYPRWQTNRSTVAFLLWFHFRCVCLLPSDFETLSERYLYDQFHQGQSVCSLWINIHNMKEHVFFEGDWILAASWLVVLNTNKLRRIESWIGHNKRLRKQTILEKNLTTRFPQADQMFREERRVELNQESTAGLFASKLWLAGAAFFVVDFFCVFSQCFCSVFTVFSLLDAVCLSSTLQICFLGIQCKTQRSGKPEKLFHAHKSATKGFRNIRHDTPIEVVVLATARVGFAKGEENVSIIAQLYMKQTLCLDLACKMYNEALVTFFREVAQDKEPDWQLRVMKSPLRVLVWLGYFRSM